MEESTRNRGCAACACGPSLCADPTTAEEHLKAIRFGGGLGIYLALLKKSIHVFLRRPLIAVLYCLITPLMVVVTYAVNEYYVDTSGGISGEAYDACGKPLDVNFDYSFNPFLASTLAAGPIITGILSTVFVQDEAKSGLLLALLGSKRGFGAFWLSWWTLFTVLDFAVALLSAGIARALPDVIFQNVSFGTIFASLFFGAGSIMLGIHFAVSISVGFTRRTDVLILLYLVLVGVYFVATLAPLFGRDTGPSYMQPENTTYLSCRSHVEEGAYTCGGVTTCSSYLTLSDGANYTGCWYLASAQDSIWDTSEGPRTTLQLVALFFIPSFHFAQIWTQIVGTVLLNGGTEYNALSYFYDSVPTILERVLDLEEPPMYVKVKNGDYVSAQQCSLDEPARVQQDGDVGSSAPSFGASLGFLSLLAFVYLACILLLMYMRGHRVLRRVKLARTNKRIRSSEASKSDPDGPEGSRRDDRLGTGAARSTSPKAVAAAGALADLDDRDGSDHLGVDINRGLFIDNVCLSFGKGRDRVDALKSVSIHVKQGKLVTLLGKNGAGKSTLVQILCTYLVQDSGRVLCNGLPVTSVSLGICLQDDRLYTELTPAEHFTLWARLRMLPAKEIPEIVERWLRVLNLYALRNFKIGTLSGGACRRVSVGLATIGTPSLILLDEPTTGMDPINQRFVWRHIETIKAHSLVILTTHSMAEADSLADEVVFLEHGRVVAAGTPLDLKLRYGSIAQFALYVRPEDVDFVVNKLDQDFAPLFMHHCIEVRTVSSGYLTVCIRRRATELAPHSSGDSTTVRSSGLQDRDNDDEGADGDDGDDEGSDLGDVIAESDSPDALAPARDSAVEDDLSSDADTIIDDADEEADNPYSFREEPAMAGTSFQHTVAEKLATSECDETGPQEVEEKAKARPASPKADTEPAATALTEVESDTISLGPKCQLIEGMAALIKWIQTPASRVREFGISNTTFEEVFLAIVEDAGRQREAQLRASVSEDTPFSEQQQQQPKQQRQPKQEQERAKGGHDRPSFDPPQGSRQVPGPEERAAQAHTRVRQLARKTHSENMSVIVSYDRFAYSAMSAPESSRRPSGFLSEDAAGPSSGSAPPLYSVVQVRTLPAAADLQLQGLEVRAHGFYLWAEQVGAIMFKNVRVRIFSWEVVAKWVVAVLLLMSITLVESTNAELRTDVLALSLLLCFVAILLIPFGVFEINTGYLQLFKLHRCTFPAVAASELFFLFVVLFANFIVALSIFMAVTVSTGVHDERLFYLCNQNAAIGCKCVVINALEYSGEDRRLVVTNTIASLGYREFGTTFWYGYVWNQPGNWFMLLAVALALALGLGGLSLILTAVFKHHRMAAFVGGVLLILWGVVPPVLVLPRLEDVMYIPAAPNCTLLTFGTLKTTFVASDTVTCAQRQMVEPSNALGLVFTIGFTMTMFDFFRGGTTTMVANSTLLLNGNTPPALSQNCTSDNTHFFNEDLGVLWAGAFLTVAVGLFAFWLRTYPPEFALVLERTLCGIWHRIDGKCDARHRSAPVSEHRYSEHDPGGSWRESDTERSCVRAERERVESLVNSFDGLKRNERDPIALANLSKTYHSRLGRVEALTDAYLAVRPGEVVGFLGPNGSAKSTLCKILNGTVAATSGQAYVVGLDVETQMTRVYPHLGYVGQRDCLWSGLTARQHLELVLHLRGAIATQQERVSLMDEVASRLDLTEYLDRKVRAMSGGMQRRLSIALAMLGSPRVVILDEPTTQLDPSTRRKVWECIQYFRESYKCAIVITTHSMEEADELCDRVCIITKGRIRAIDSPQGLKDRFGNGYVLILKIFSGRRQEALNFVKENVYPQAVLGNCLNDVMRIYFPRDGFDVGHAFSVLFSERAQTEGYIANFLLNQATLHDVFMNIAGLDEAHLEEIGYLNENAHELVVRLLRHRGLRASGAATPATAPPTYPHR